jgi:hypothetical protein
MPFNRLSQVLEKVPDRAIRTEYTASRTQAQLHIESVPFNDTHMAGFMFVAYKTFQIDVCG